MRHDRPVLLFPGHAAYLEDALPELRRSYEEVDEVLAEVDEALVALGGKPLSGLLLSDSPPVPERLLADDPDTVPLAGFATSVALHRILVRHGVEPALVAGHSQGEIAALAAAGVYDAATGATILHRRNEALRTVAGTGDMTAISMGAERAAALVALVDDPGLVLAVESGSSQSVVSGPFEALATVERLAEAAGESATRLQVPYAAHNPLIASAAELFYESIKDLRQRPLRVPAYSPILGRAYSDADEIAALLARHFTIPVRFASAIRVLHGRGARTFAECGARAMLTGKIDALVPGVTTVVCLDGRRPPDESLGTALTALTGDGGVSADAAKGADEKPVPAPSEPAVVALDRETVLTELREMYAGALEYPVEVLEADLELEADLGVDSLRQTELLVRAAERYGFERPREGIRIVQYGTLDRIADLVLELADPKTAAVNG